MPHLTLGWQVSLTLAAVFVGLAVLLHLLVPPSRWRQLVAASLQAAMLVGLYGLWGLVGEHAEGSVDGAQERGQALWDLERRLHVLSEATAQAPLLPHPWLTQLANVYYVYGHVNVLIALLAWVWWRHRADYRRLCVVIVLFTATSSAVQLISVAPPRLLPGHLVVDTAVLYGQSVYGPADPGAISQLAAMPSIHVGWALLVGLVVAALGRTWRRWLALGHSVLMSLVVVVTGNHYWVDGVVAAGLLALSLVAVSLLAAAWPTVPVLLLFRRPAEVVEPDVRRDDEAVMPLSAP